MRFRCDKSKKLPTRLGVLLLLTGSIRGEEIRLAGSECGGQKFVQQPSEFFGRDLVFLNVVSGLFPRWKREITLMDM